MKAKSPLLWAMVITLHILFTGCHQSYNINNHSRISDFPTPPHNYNIEMFFPGELPEDNQYIRTHIFEVVAPAGTPYTSLVHQMREKASASNVDAVIIINKGNYSQWFSDKTTLDYVSELVTGQYIPEDYSLVEETKLAGLGIKYKANVDYLTKYRLVDQLHLFDSEKQEYTHIANLYPDFNNIIFEVENTADSNEGVFHYAQYIKKHSLAFLMDDKSSAWKHSLNATTGKLKKRKYTDPTTQNRISVSFNYNDAGKLNALKTRHRQLGRIPEEYLLELEMDSLGRFSEKIVKNAEGAPIFIEWFYYNEEGYLVNSLIYSIEDGKESPFLKIDYLYYQEEDVYTYF